MYYDAFLKVVEKIKGDETIERREKQDIVDSLFEKISTIGEVNVLIIDTKIGIRKGITQQEYTNKINRAIIYSQELDEIFAKNGLGKRFNIKDGEIFRIFDASEKLCFEANEYMDRIVREDRESNE